MKYISGLIGLMIIVSAISLDTGCKREGGSTSGGGGASPNRATSANGGSASGPGAVSANDKQIIYQNLHIFLPWEVEQGKLVAITMEAASGKGLTLAKEKTELKISSDGRSVTLNGQDYGNVKPGDRIVLQADGKLMVNDAERKPQAGAATSPK